MARILAILGYLIGRFLHAFICIAGPVLIVSVMLLLLFHFAVFFYSLYPSMSSLTLIVLFNNY